MADDQPRPTENDNKDAENQIPRANETDSEAESDASDEESVAEPDVEAEPTADSDAEEEATAVNVPAPDAVEPPDTGDDPDAREDRDSEEVPDTETAPDAEDAPDAGATPATGPRADVPEDVRKYERFKKMDGAQYDRVNEFLRERTYITAREWAIARLCADFRTETGVEMTKIGENLPELVPFMTDTYTPQAVNQARSSFETKVRQAGATFLYGAMSGFFTAEELDDMMYEVTEVAKFLLEVEGVDLSVEEELEAEDRISGVMREVQSASEQLRHDEMECPNCGHEMEASDSDTIDSGSAKGDD
jgi:hypothetical protein